MLVFQLCCSKEVLAIVTAQEQNMSMSEWNTRVWCSHYGTGRIGYSFPSLALRVVTVAISQKLACCFPIGSLIKPGAANKKYISFLRSHDRQYSCFARPRLQLFPFHILGGSG